MSLSNYDWKLDSSNRRSRNWLITSLCLLSFYLINHTFYTSQLQQLVNRYGWGFGLLCHAYSTFLGSWIVAVIFFCIWCLILIQQLKWKIMIAPSSGAHASCSVMCVIRHKIAKYRDLASVVGWMPSRPGLRLGRRCQRGRERSLTSWRSAKESVGFID